MPSSPRYEIARGRLLAGGGVERGARQRHRAGLLPGVQGQAVEPIRGERVNAADRGHFFFNDTATTEIYTLSLHDALPIYRQHVVAGVVRGDADAQQRRAGLLR